MAAHLVILPVFLPLLMSALLLLTGKKQQRTRETLSLLTAATLLGVSGLLLVAVGKTGPLVYLLGSWRAPFGIVLVADRLSAVMVALVSLLGFAALLYAGKRWERGEPRFRPLFLLLLAGVNGAFLTGDLFNLFVFFELLLAASYGLALHGGGRERLRINLHYITINIVASLFFLVGIAVLYGLTGTLNMADMARRLAALPPGSVLPTLGLAALGLAFLVKAAAWPLGFWLTPTYAAAMPPVAAVFAIMTKVGIYILLRLTGLFTGGSFAHETLIFAGLLTITFGMLNILSTQKLARVAGYYLMVSSGTLLAAVGFGGAALQAALLYYLLTSTLSVSALYLLTELVRQEVYGETLLETVGPVFSDEDVYSVEEEEDEFGIAIPGTIALLGGGFIFCTLLLAGLPPLSGFIAKFAIIDALFRAPEISPSAWALITLIILAGLATLISLTRAGIELLWVPSKEEPAVLRLREVLPVGLLLMACGALVVFAGPVYHYLEGAAALVNDPAPYIHAVLQATP